MTKDGNQKQNMIKVWAFIGAIGLVTLVFIIVLFSMASVNKSYKSYENINKKGKTLDGTSLFQLDSGEYFIYFYSSDEEKVQMNYTKQNSLEPFVVNYFDFYKQNEKKYANEIIPIILLDVSTTTNQRCLGTETTTSATSWTNFTIDKSTLPILLDMTVTTKDNKLSYSYKIYEKQSDIQKKFQAIISLIPVAYLPSISKEEYA